MTTPETLGKRLFWARLQLAARRGEATGQGDLGELVGLTGATVSRYEADKQEPDLGTIVRLAAALGVSPGWLAFGEAAALTTITNGLPPAEFVPRPVPRPMGAAKSRRKSG